MLALTLAALHAILKSELFWFMVAGAFVSLWLSWIVGGAVKDAIAKLDLAETVREAVREAMDEAKEEAGED
jgi:hypothetical protein